LKDSQTILKKGELELRRCGEKDLETLVYLLSCGRRQMLSRGFEQWDEGFVSQTSALEILRRGEAYVIYADGTPCCTAQFCLREEPEYEAIRGEGWRCDSFMAVHRVASDPSVPLKGKGDLVFAFAAEYARLCGRRSLRIDTADENKAMQRCLERNGFECRGRVTLATGEDHPAYELVLTEDKII